MVCEDRGGIGNHVPVLSPAQHGGGSSGGLGVVLIVRLAKSWGRGRVKDSLPCQKGYQKLKRNRSKKKNLTLAVCLDGGVPEAERVVRRLFFGGPDAAGEDGAELDAKSRLQILLQARDLGIPHYEVVSVSGPSHAEGTTAAAPVSTAFWTGLIADLLNPKKIGRAHV